jgi:RimJ/RimL family protein N-acetyltransferase
MAELFETRVFEPLTLTTQRLLLRPFTDADVESVWHACSDELTQAWLPLPRPYTLEDARAFCPTFIEEERLAGSGVHCAIVLKETDEFVGCIGLTRTAWITRCTEIGYWSSPGYRGQGYISEATRALADWTLDNGMERVALMIAPGNTGSLAVAAKAGFTFEGTLRNRGFVHSGRVDLTVWSRIPADR